MQYTLQYTKLPVQRSRRYVVQIIIRPREDFQRGVSQALIDYTVPLLHLGRRWVYGESGRGERMEKGERRDERGGKNGWRGESEKRM